MVTVIKFDDIDFTTIAFSNPVKNMERVYESEAFLEDADSKVYIQTPDMKIRKFLNSAEIDKSQVDLEISDNTFYQLLRHIDAHIIKNIFERRHVWFPKKDISMAIIEDYYKSPVLKQTDSDAKQSCVPVIRINMNHEDKKIYTTYFVNKEAKAIDDLCQETVVAGIVQLRGLKMSKGSITPDWVVHTFRSNEVIVKRPKFKELLETDN